VVTQPGVSTLQRGDEVELSWRAESARIVP